MSMFEMKKASINNIKQNKFISLFPSILFLVCTFFVFGPLELYFTNYNEFWFSLGHIIPGILISSVAVMVILFGVGWLTKGRVMGVFSAIIFGIAIAFYIQGNFLLSDFGVLDGQAIDWDKFAGWGVVSAILWIFCICIPVFFALKKPMVMQKCSQWTSCFIVAIQMVTILTLFFTTNLKSSIDVGFADQSKLEISKNKNILVFVVDTLDQQFFEDCLEAYPECKEIFKDFTYFDDALGSFPYTTAAVSHILTGTPYDNSVLYTEYMNKKISDNPMYQLLQKENYDVSLFTLFTSPAMLGKVSNAIEIKAMPRSYVDLTKMFYQLVAFKYTPQALKEFFWLYTGDFNELKIDADSRKLYEMQDVAFYQDLQNVKLEASLEKNAFKLFHLQGSHGPFEYDENVKNAPKESTSLLQQTRGALKLVEEYLLQLREMGLYDSAGIMVLADHGALMQRQSPALLVKQPFTQQEKMVISSASISYLENLLPTISSFIDTTTRNGKTVFDIVEGDPIMRKYFYYNLDDSWKQEYLPDIYEYEFVGKTIEMNQQHRTGKIYMPNKIVSADNYKVYECAIGLPVNMFDDDFIDKAVVFGLYPPTENFIWSLGEETQINLKLDSVKSNLKIDFKFSHLAQGQQRLQLYANEQFAGELLLTAPANTASFIITKNMLTDDILKLSLRYPDAAPLSKDDLRVGAIAYQSMTLNWTNPMSGR